MSEDGLTEYECRECGEAFTAEEGQAASDLVCPNCGAVVGSGPLKSVAAEPSLDPRREDSRNPRMVKLLSIVALGIGGLLLFLGGLALHIWTAYLFYQHGGLFWGVMALFFPPLSEIVALVLCFWWGVWFYVLAIAGFLAGAACFGLGGDAGESPRSSLAALVAAVLSALALAGSFGYLAVGYARAPEAITLEDRKHVDDLAVATCSVLNAAMSDDPDVASRVPEGKARLREGIPKCPQDLKPVLRAKVDSFLRVFALLHNDVEIYARALGRAGSPVFQVSDRTRSAMNKLPEPIRADIEAQIASLEAVLSQKAGTSLNRPTGAEIDEVLRRLAAERKRCWAKAKETYEDLLGAAMPSEAELIGRSD